MYFFHNTVLIAFIGGLLMLFGWVVLPDSFLNHHYLLYGQKRDPSKNRGRIKPDKTKTCYFESITSGSEDLTFFISKMYPHKSFFPLFT